MSGKVWSPDPHTAPGHLVTLSHLLYQFVELGGADKPELLDEIDQTMEFFKRLV
jgi:hypothetical protein